MSDVKHTPAYWTSLRKALWQVVMEAEINGPRYIFGNKLTDALHDAALTALRSSPIAPVAPGVREAAQALLASRKDIRNAFRIADLPAGWSAVNAEFHSLEAALAAEDEYEVRWAARYEWGLANFICETKADAQERHGKALDFVPVYIPKPAEPVLSVGEALDRLAELRTELAAGAVDLEEICEASDDLRAALARKEPS